MRVVAIAICAFAKLLKGAAAIATFDQDGTLWVVKRAPVSALVGHSPARPAATSELSNRFPSANRAKIDTPTGGLRRMRTF